MARAHHVLGLELEARGVLVPVLTNLGVVLFGTALGLALAVNIETALAHRDVGARPPRLLSWHVFVVTIYALGFHAKVTWNHLAGIGRDEHLTGRLIAYVLLGLAGNIAMLLVFRVTTTRRAIARDLEAALAEHRADVELEAGG